MSIVTIDLTRHPPNMPLGMLLAPGAGGPSTSSSSTPSYTGETFGNYFSNTPQQQSSSSSPTSSNVTLVAGWEHDTKTGGRHLGPIQRSGLVRLGDRLVRINGKDVTDWTFREVMDALKELVRNSQSPAATQRKRLKTLGFAPSGTAEWSRGTLHHQAGGTAMSDSMFFGLFSFQQQQSSLGDDALSARVVHSKRMYSFVSFIGRWRVAQGSTESSSEIVNENGNELDLQQRLQQQQQQEQQQEVPDDSEEQLRQHSENSDISEIERQLNKEPSIKYDKNTAMDMIEDDERGSSFPPREGDVTTTSVDESSQTNTDNNKPYIQYEIQCHILFRDTSSFQSHAPAGMSNTNSNNIHHSWSVWKRFSELQRLDEELRYDFGWQMDALNDGRGFAFPSAHGLESWWYGVRNGGGVVTSLLGGGGTEGEEKKVGDDVVMPAAGTQRHHQNGSTANEDGGGWGSGLLGMFRAGYNSEDAGSTVKVNGTGMHTNGSTHNEKDMAKDNNSTTPVRSNSNCPLPPSFVEKRRKELAVYWTNLMKIEEIFEFGDIHSHKFGKTMAKFLEVDKVLLSKKNGSLGAVGGMASAASGNGQIHQQHHNQQQQQQYQSTFPAIQEEETEAFGTGYIRPPSFTTSSASVSQTREVSAFHDDDVSILSDGTGAFADVTSAYTPNRSIGGSPGPLGGVVDIVPKKYSTAIGNTAQSSSVGRRAASNASVASSSVNSAKRRSGKKAAAPRAKPAFQRQFLSP